MIRSSSKEIGRLAAEWAARVHGGKMTADDQTRFDAWLAADMCHLGAYARVEASLVRLERLRAVGGGPLREMVSSVGESEMISSADGNWTRRRIVLTGSAAAVCLAAAGVASFVLLGGNPQQSFATGMGETRMVPLLDGSVVTLNTNSQITVNFTKSVREVHLVRGEALFSVAKNKQRPFIVMAAEAEVRAVGTSFTVRILPQRPVQVVVQEGVVEVNRRGNPVSAPVRIGAQTRTLVPQDAPIVTDAIPPVQIERNLAWRYGRIAFENETLEDAAKEFGRYNNKQIVVDSAIANRTITGRFASNDPVGFATAVASALNLRTEVSSDQVLISP